MNQTNILTIDHLGTGMQSVRVAFTVETTPRMSFLGDFCSFSKIPKIKKKQKPGKKSSIAEQLPRCKIFQKHTAIKHKMLPNENHAVCRANQKGGDMSVTGKGLIGLLACVDIKDFD